MQNLFSKTYQELIRKDDSPTVVTLEYGFHKFRCLNSECRHIFAKDIHFASRNDNVTYRLENEIARLVMSDFSYGVISAQLQSSITRQAVGQIFNRWVRKKDELRAVQSSPSNIAIISGLTDRDRYTMILNLSDGIKVYDVLYGVQSLDIAAALRRMGYIFENLVQRFSESYNEEAGAHFTSRDIIYLMCDLLLTNNDTVTDDDSIHCTVYDMTMGTSQMLTCMEERLKQLDSNASVQTFGQELNPFTMGIAVADTMIHNSDPDNMKFGDTLSDDKFAGYEFDFVISNPPFGIDWKREATVVEAEHKKGKVGRFAPGLPSKSDGQMLFLMNGVKKLKGTGRMAIIQNGSSLFTGDAESGQSNIRRYLIENDWLDAIVQLPNDSFYNTGIATYIWIINKDKPQEHKQKVQLIDASKCRLARRKPIGNKRYDIAQASRDMIAQAYGEYQTKDYTGVEEDGKPIICKSKVVDGISLGYSKVVVETPVRNEDGSLLLKRGKKVADTTKHDTESIPLTEEIDEYIAREVLPYNPDAWVDESKTKIGYEIPFTRMFYEYTAIEPSADIAARIAEREQSLMAKLHELFREEA